jgi:hypothetical protein
MQSNRTAKGADCNDAADLSKHDCEARSRKFDVNHRFPAALGVKKPLPSSR